MLGRGSMLKVIKISSAVLLLFIAVSAAGIIFYFFKSKGDVEKVPAVFGYKPLTILSNSMQPAFNAGDIILINENHQPNVNDVVTYKHQDGILVTHRIIDKVNQGGEAFFKAKGDNNNVEDDNLVPKSAIIGVEQFVIPNGGYVAKFVSGPIGFILLIVVPLLLYAIIEIFQRLGLIGNKKEQIQG
jgi:signal peptidase I